MLKRLTVAAAALLLLAPSAGADWSPPAREGEFRPATPLIIAGEAGAACAGGLLVGAGLAVAGGAIGFLVDGSLDPPTASMLIGMGLGEVAGISLGNSIGTGLVGRACRQGGQGTPSFFGALAGTLVGAPLTCVGVSGGIFPLVLVAPLLPTAGAVIGYNLSRPKPAPTGSLLNRIQMPAIAFCPDVADPGTASLNLKLLSVRF